MIMLMTTNRRSLPNNNRHSNWPDRSLPRLPLPHLTLALFAVPFFSDKVLVFHSELDAG